MSNRRARICIDKAASVEKLFSEQLNQTARATISWRSEKLGFKLFKTYGTKWMSHVGETGTWVFPTVYRSRTMLKIVNVHWRFEGVENGLPVFYFGDAFIDVQPVESSEKPETKGQGNKLKVLNRVLLALVALLGVLTLFFDGLGALGDSMGAAAESIVAFTALIAAILTGN